MSKQGSKLFSSYLILLTIDLIIKKFGKPLKISINNIINWHTKLIKFTKIDFYTFFSTKLDWKKILLKLKLFGFKFIKHKILVPYWRLDINNVQDLIEEKLK